MRTEMGTVRSASAFDREHTKARSRTPSSGSPCSEPMRTTMPLKVRITSGFGVASGRGTAVVAKTATHPQIAMPTTVARTRGLIRSSLHGLAKDSNRITRDSAGPVLRRDARAIHRGMRRVGGGVRTLASHSARSAGTDATRHRQSPSGLGRHVSSRTRRSMLRICK